MENAAKSNFKTGHSVLIGTVGSGYRLHRICASFFKNSFKTVCTLSAGLLCALYILFILLPVLAIISISGITGITSAIGDAASFSALRLSLVTSAASLLLTFLFGTPAAFYIYRPGAGKLSSVLGVLSSIPFVLPPAVAGIGLLLAFGRNGIPALLPDKPDLHIVFTPFAVILAQFFVSSGFYIQVLGTAVRRVEPEIYDISYVLGAGRSETFFRIILPMLAKPVVTGLLLAWSRSAGEFGATMMFAGNMEGITRTVPLAIYTYMQTDIRQAAGMSVVLAFFSFSAMYVIRSRLQE